MSCVQCFTEKRLAKNKQNKPLLVEVVDYHGVNTPNKVGFRLQHGIVEGRNGKRNWPYLLAGSATTLDLFVKKSTPWTRGMYSLWMLTESLFLTVSF